MKTYGTGSRTARLGTLVAALVAAGTIPSIASAQSGSWSQTATGLQLGATPRTGPAAWSPTGRTIPRHSPPPA